jgi:beta-lactamase class A
MKRSLFSLLLAFVLVSGCSPRPNFDDLERDLTSLSESFDGVVGIYVKDLTTGEEIAIQADTLFPTASMIKVPIMLTIFDRIERGELAYQQELIYKDSLFYSDEDITGEFKDSASVLLSEMVELSITNSDNTASLWLQELAGTGVAINNWLSSQGFEGTRMNSRTPDRRPDWEKYGWGQTTPREMARLLEMIRTGTAISPAASEEMYRVLTRIYWNDTALSQIPPTVQAASKQGAVNASKSEVVLVNAPSGDYLFCVITKNQTDERWDYDNAGAELIREVSKRLWNAFEPNHPYTQANGYMRYVGP